MNVEELTSILQVDRGEWEALAGDEVFWRYGWLQTQEDSTLFRDRSRYLVLRGMNGIVAAAVCQVQEPGEAAAGIDLTLFGRFAPVARAAGFRLTPALMCGPRVGLASHVRVRGDVPPKERRAVVGSLVRAMKKLAHAQQRTLCFRNVRADDVVLCDLLANQGFVCAAEMPGTIMAVTWSTFEEYVRALKKQHPSTAKSISREVNRSRDRGVVFRRIEDPAAFEPRLHQLLCDHHRRLNDGDFPYGPSFICRLRERLGDNLVLFAALQEDLPIAISVGFRTRDTLYLPMVGVDDARRKDSFAYFNNCYNEPIRYAIEHGLRSMYCGKLLYDLKQRRGFGIVPLYVYLRPPGRIRRVLLRPVAASQVLRVRAMVHADGGAQPSRAEPTT